jgi:predicted GNAT family acetyltransferase
MTHAIRHDAANQRFELEVDGAICYLAYSRSDRVVTFLHTVVPPELEGQGLASELTRHALELARENGDRIVPRCSFSAAYVRRHPEYQDLIATDVS